MKTTLLDEEQFLATFAAPMRDVTREVTNVIDIWPYVEAVPAEDLRGHEVYDHSVEYVYRDAKGRFDHVLVMTRTRNVYLTVVVDLGHEVVHGHHLLDLNEKYGVAGPEGQPSAATDAARAWIKPSDRTGAEVGPGLWWCISQLYFAWGLRIT